MSEKTLGQIAYEAFTAVRYDGSLTTAWTSPAVAHKAWEATGQAVAAHVANPDAADYDSAAEITRLHAALVDAMLRWSGRDRADVDQCASELAQILDQHPLREPQPAPSRAELETAMAAALQNLIDEDDDEDDREYLSTIIEMLTVFDDDRIMIEHLLSGRNRTPEGAALLKIWEIGRRAIEGRAPSLRAILAEVLDSYGQSGSAHVSRVSRVTVIRWRVRAGLPISDAERRMIGG